MRDRVALSTETGQQGPEGNPLRQIRMILPGCIPLAFLTAAALPVAPSGLTCTAANGAVIRLNVDPGARQFQKEGFPIMPIREPGDHVIVLMRAVVKRVLVQASIDRKTMIYTAQSKDLQTRAITRMTYHCVAGAPFETGVGLGSDHR